MPRALLVYPEFPPSYWSEKYAVEFLGKKAAMPPLGLLTLASLFPPHYELRIVDMNVGRLKDRDLCWCDAVFLSAMIVQKDSFHKVVGRAKSKGLKVIAGGPYPTSFLDEMREVDVVVQGEVEEFFCKVIADLENDCERRLYSPALDLKGEPCRPDIRQTPIPRYDLLPLKKYGSVALQFSRGCPFNCEFCDITKLYGRRTRTKSSGQMLREFEFLYDCGWRGSVFLVDDNFVGNKKAVREVLPALAAWQKAKKYPFTFYTEASVDLASHEDLLQGMADAGFDMVFLGLETPNPKALLQCKKAHNVSADTPGYLLSAVRRIQQYGMEVSAGFILGLDGDTQEGFDAQVSFIQRAGIPTAMVGLLNVLKGTDLYKRYEREGRLLGESWGNNVSAFLNYVPEIDSDTLIAGYRRVLASLYDSNLKNYFERCHTLLVNWRQRRHAARRIRWTEIVAVWRSLSRQTFSKHGPAYLRFLLRTVFSRPLMFPEAIRLAIMGYHYQRITREQLRVDEFLSYLEAQRLRVRGSLFEFAERGSEQVADARKCLNTCFSDIRKRYRGIDKDFRALTEEALVSFEASLRAYLEELKERLQLEMHGAGLAYWRAAKIAK